QTETTGQRVEAEAPSQAAFAAGVARGVIADAVPPQRRPWVALATIVVVTVVAVFLFRGCAP
ncbi:MAG: hypothetical protein R3344_11370, partial [Acidobacteriota bacterium]|nr:hypothetical protein [Acidobacteriota bacterium]